MAAKPIRGTCTGCAEWLEGDDIFHWSATDWMVWCWACYKREHLPNLYRLTQDKDTPT